MSGGGGRALLRAGATGGGWAAAVAGDEAAARSGARREGTRKIEFRGLRGPEEGAQILGLSCLTRILQKSPLRGFWLAPAAASAGLARAGARRQGHTSTDGAGVRRKKSPPRLAQVSETYARFLRSAGRETAKAFAGAGGQLTRNTSIHIQEGRSSLE